MSTSTPLRSLLLAILLAALASSGTLALAAADDDDSGAAAAETAGDDDSAAAVAAGDDDSAGDAAPAAEPVAAAVPATEICDDGQDNDGDGLVDCKDLNDCAAFATCGQIRGGWGWVIAAYGISFAALLVYTFMVTLRLRSQQRRGGS
jgi:hypothetical protein